MTEQASRRCARTLPELGKVLAHSSTSPGRIWPRILARLVGYTAPRRVGWQATVESGVWTHWR